MKPKEEDGYSPGQLKESKSNRKLMRRRFVIKVLSIIGLLIAISTAGILAAFICYKKEAVAGFTAWCNDQTSNDQTFAGDCDAAATDPSNLSSLKVYMLAIVFPSESSTWFLGGWLYDSILRDATVLIVLFILTTYIPKSSFVQDESCCDNSFRKAPWNFVLVALWLFVQGELILYLMISYTETVAWEDSAWTYTGFACVAVCFVVVLVMLLTKFDYLHILLVSLIIAWAVLYILDGFIRTTNPEIAGQSAAWLTVYTLTQLVGINMMVGEYEYLKWENFEGDDHYLFAALTMLIPANVYIQILLVMGFDEDNLERLNEERSDPNLRDNMDLLQTTQDSLLRLETACRFGDEPVLNVAITKGMPVHIKYPIYDHLRHATVRGHLNIVKTLLNEPKLPFGRHKRLIQEAIGEADNTDKISKLKERETLLGDKVENEKKEMEETRKFLEADSELEVSPETVECVAELNNWLASHNDDYFTAEYDDNKHTFIEWTDGVGTKTGQIDNLTQWTGGETPGY